jgi:hypothetical protein
MGAAPENDIVLPDPLVGDAFAHILFDGQTYTIATLSRKSDLMVNGNLNQVAESIIQTTGRAAASGSFTVARNVWVRYAQTGAAATAGSALFVLEYLPQDGVVVL